MEKNQQEIKKLAEQMAAFYAKRREEVQAEDVGFVKNLDEGCSKHVVKIGKVHMCRGDERLIIPSLDYCPGVIVRTWYFDSIPELLDIIDEYWDILIPKDTEFYAGEIADRLEDVIELEAIEIEQGDCLAPWLLCQWGIGIYCYACGENQCFPV